MKLSLFVPCLVNHLFPHIAIDTLQVLEKLGHQVSYPRGQTCCGQMMTNSGCMEIAEPAVAALCEALLREPCDAIVAPAASCVFAAKENIERMNLPGEAKALVDKFYELTEFLHDVAPIQRELKPIRRVVSMQMSCHGLRMLGLGTSSELALPPGGNKLHAILSRIPELTITQPARDECCGFGGTFAVDESDISGKMARDKIEQHVATGADAIVGYDPSCMMSLGGVVSRDNVQLEVLHLSALLNQAL